MAHKKAAGSSRNGRDSNAQRRGVKRYGGEKVKAGLEELDWSGRRELIRTVVKRVEIDPAHINVVFRVDEPTFPGRGNGTFSQHCWRSHRSAPTSITPRNLQDQFYCESYKV